MSRAPHENSATKKLDEAILRLVIELAKKHAREDHDAEVAARLASPPAIPIARP
jgi:hypothetical protein